MKLRKRSELRNLRRKRYYSVSLVCDPHDSTAADSVFTKSSKTAESIEREKRKYSSSDNDNDDVSRNFEVRRLRSNSTRRRTLRFARTNPKRSQGNRAESAGQLNSSFTFNFRRVNVKMKQGRRSQTYERKDSSSIDIKRPTQLDSVLPNDRKQTINVPLNYNYSTRSKSTSWARSRKEASPRCCRCPCGESENKILFPSTRRDYKSLHNRGFTALNTKVSISKHSSSSTRKCSISKSQTTHVNDNDNLNRDHYMSRAQIISRENCSRGLSCSISKEYPSASSTTQNRNGSILNGPWQKDVCSSKAKKTEFRTRNNLPYSKIRHGRNERNDDMQRTTSSNKRKIANERTGSDGHNYMTRTNFIISTSITRHGKVYIDPLSTFEHLYSDDTCARKKVSSTRRTSESESDNSEENSSESEEEELPIEYFTRSRSKADFRRRKNYFYDYDRTESESEDDDSPVEYFTRSKRTVDCRKTRNSSNKHKVNKQDNETNQKIIKKRKSIDNEDHVVDSRNTALSDNSSESESEQSVREYITRGRINGDSRKTRNSVHTNAINNKPYSTKTKVLQKRKFIKNKNSNENSWNDSSSESEIDQSPREYLTRNKLNLNSRKTRNSSYKRTIDDAICTVEKHALSKKTMTDNTDSASDYSTQSNSTERESEPAKTTAVECLTRSRSKANGRKTRNSYYATNSSNVVGYMKKNNQKTANEANTDSHEIESDSSCSSASEDEQPAVQYITRNRKKAQFRKTRNGIYFNTMINNDIFDRISESEDKHSLTSSKDSTICNFRKIKTNERLEYSPQILKNYIKIRNFDWNKLQDFDWVKFSSLYSARGAIDISKIDAKTLSKYPSLSYKDCFQPDSNMLKRIQNTPFFCSQPLLPRIRTRTPGKETIGQKPDWKSPSILDSDKSKSCIIRRLQNTPCSISDLSLNVEQNRKHLRNSRSNSHARESYLNQSRTSKTKVEPKNTKATSNGERSDITSNSSSGKKSETTEVSYIDKMIQEKNEFFSKLDLVRGNLKQTSCAISTNNGKRFDPNRCRKISTRSSLRGRKKKHLKSSQSQQRKKNSTKEKINTYVTTAESGYRKYIFPMKRKRLLRWENEKEDEEISKNKRICFANQSVTKPMAHILPNNAAVSTDQSYALKNNGSSPFSQFIPSSNDLSSTHRYQSKRLSWTSFKENKQMNVVKPVAHVRPRINNEGQIENKDGQPARQKRTTDDNSTLSQRRSRSFTHTYSDVTNNTQQIQSTYKLNSLRNKEALRRNRYVLRNDGDKKINVLRFINTEPKQTRLSIRERKEKSIKIPYHTRNNSNHSGLNTSAKLKYFENASRKSEKRNNDTSQYEFRRSVSRKNKMCKCEKVKNDFHHYELRKYGNSSKLGKRGSSSRENGISQNDFRKHLSRQNEPSRYKFTKRDLQRYGFRKKNSSTKNDFSKNKKSKTSNTTIWTSYNKDRKRKLKEEKHEEESQSLTSSKIPQPIKWKASSHVSMIKQTLNDYGGKLTFNDMQDYVNSINKTSSSLMLLHAVRLSVKRKQVFCHQDEVVTKDVMKTIEEEKVKEENKSVKHSSLVNSRYSYRILKRELLKT